jgi:hypothetical protein
VYQQATEEGKTATARLFAFFGMRKTPLDFSLGKDETLALEFLKRRGEREPNTKEQAEVRRQVKLAAQGYRDAKVTQADVAQMAQRGEITYQDARRIMLDAKKPWIYRLFLALHPAEKIAVFEAATPEHKKALVELLHLTPRDIRQNPKADWEVWRDEMQRLREGQTAKPAPEPVANEPGMPPPVNLTNAPRPAPEPVM